MTNGEKDVGVEIFSVDRRHFILALEDFLRDDTVSLATRADEIKGTISAIRQVAALYGMNVDA